MNADVQSKLKKLRDDYSQIRRQPFRHFFCPILFRDEDVPICKAHIVNLAFADSSRDWTIQRKDVDNFYGLVFETDFLGLQYRENRNIGNTITDKRLSKKYSPKILVDGEPVEFFVADGDVPKQFTRVEFDNNGEVIRLGLKISPENMFAAMGKSWEITASKDIRIPALSR